MDVTELELLLAAVDSMWSTPMTDSEIADWAQILRPRNGDAPLDVTVAGHALLVLKRTSQGRPTIGVFRAKYVELAAVAQVVAVDDDSPASTDTVRAVITEARSHLRPHDGRRVWSMPASTVGAPGVAS